MDLTDGVTTVPGVGSIMAGKLAKLGIKSIFDLLYHLPFRYEDRRLVSPARGVQVGESVTVVGALSEVKNIFTKNGKRLQTATITDSSGSLAVIWFNHTYLARVFSSESQVALFGKVDFFNKRPALISPEYEFVTSESESIHLRRLVPIYPETAGVSSKWLRTKIYSLLQAEGIAAQLTALDRETIPGGQQALGDIHFPRGLDQVQPARHRLAFTELLLLQLAAGQRKQQWQATILAHPFNIDQEKIREFISHLPFNLTSSQNVVVKEILADLGSSQPMNRLLAGDVGSGKTVVAAIAAYVAYLNGWQTTLLAPTQILATQHFQTLQALFNPLGIQVGLVMAGKKKSEGDIVVGTQALLSDSLKIPQVGLVVIDEQHRFGVAQRAAMAAQGKSPHILTMTATPIPRTIALTMYGDLDLSTLTELPAGRLPVKTWVVPENKRQAAYQWITSQILDTRSGVFIVCPFIESSESLTSVKAATVEFTRLTDLFPQFKLGLLHGRLAVKKKNEVINRFREGQLDILVTTPVVEVGIDIPQAAVMVIEGAERFGLAQLHQLRGRVGRGDIQSYCLLFSTAITPRLLAMQSLHTGIELAEIDLKLRGPGEVYGLAQHGQHNFKIANYSDLDLIGQAKAAAAALLPRLAKLQVLRSLVEKDKIGLVTPN